MRAFRAQGLIEGRGQTDTGMDGYRGRSDEGSNRDAPLRASIIETGPLIMAEMCNRRMPRREGQKP